MYTREGFKKKIGSILDIADLDENVGNVLKELVNEREEFYDTIAGRHTIEDGADEFDFDAGAFSDGEWERKYQDMRQKYIDRFLEGETVINSGDNSGWSGADREIDDADGNLEKDVKKGIAGLFE